jgi:hypothetical protein
VDVEQMQRMILDGLERVAAEEASVITKHARPARFTGGSTVAGTYRPRDGQTIQIIEPREKQ